MSLSHSSSTRREGELDALRNSATNNIFPCSCGELCRVMCSGIPQKLLVLCTGEHLGKHLKLLCRVRTYESWISHALSKAIVEDCCKRARLGDTALLLDINEGNEMRVCVCVTWAQQRGRGGLAIHALFGTI